MEKPTVNKGADYYLSTYRLKPIKELEGIKEDVSLKLRETNNLLANIRINFENGKENRYQHSHLCQVKTSLELKLQAINKVIREKYSSELERVSQIPTEEKFLDIHKDESIEDLTSTCLSLQAKLSEVNSFLSYAKASKKALRQGFSLADDLTIKELEGQRIRLSREVNACNQLKRKKKNQPAKESIKKIPLFERYETQKVHSALAYDIISSRSHFLCELCIDLIHEVETEKALTLLHQRLEIFLGRKEGVVHPQIQRELQSTKKYLLECFDEGIDPE